MSASLLVDLGNTCQLAQSVPTPGQMSPSGLICGASGALIGQSIDLLHSDTFCNLVVVGNNVAPLSGAFIFGVQTADNDVSGQFTDPTSGLPQFPTTFSSGGLLWLNSGSTGGTFGAQTSGQSVLSGFVVAAGFQRLGRYARVNFRGDIAACSGSNGSLTAGFVTNFRTTGSGGGFSFAPGSGTVNV